MPVGAWAIRQQPVLTALYTASASWRWPWRNPAWGKARVSSAALRAPAWVSSCSAQAMKRWHCSSKKARRSQALWRSANRVSFWLPISK
ncbi:hypothetical protein D9M71_751690 [compost metagenome]